MKTILITGSNSYVGTSFEKWLKTNQKKINVKKLSVRNNEWMHHEFNSYDTILHAAALVHESEKGKTLEEYLIVNTVLTKKLAIKAKAEGVKHFIFLSSMAVFGEESDALKMVTITPETNPVPSTLYGHSKLEAENELLKLEDSSFSITIIRPPLIYGANCPGNFSRLNNISTKISFFPYIKNSRSMINIEDLSEVIYQSIQEKKTKIIHPQDKEYMNTSILIKKLGILNGRKINLIYMDFWIVKFFINKSTLLKKVFGNLVYSKEEK
ncbi:NAD-dependent epimerase/dehydratase family protein [Exiguobacterium acetylicum]|uniref:NAD-dependent epimerase/dehydratase family protein n=1 Tax=Exiguobacterium acetylicum TaxID=41170 RepID=UPI0034D58FD5